MPKPDIERRQVDPDRLDTELHANRAVTMRFSLDGQGRFVDETGKDIVTASMSLGFRTLVVRAGFKLLGKLLKESQGRNLTGEGSGENVSARVSAGDSFTALDPLKGSTDEPRELLTPEDVSQEHARRVRVFEAMLEKNEQGRKFIEFITSIASQISHHFRNGFAEGADRECAGEFLKNPEFNEASVKWFEHLDRGIFSFRDPSLPGIQVLVALPNSPIWWGAYDYFDGKRPEYTTITGTKTPAIIQDMPFKDVVEREGYAGGKRKELVDRSNTVLRRGEVE